MSSCRVAFVALLFLFALPLFADENEKVESYNREDGTYVGTYTRKPTTKKGPPPSPPATTRKPTAKQKDPRSSNCATDAVPKSTKPDSPAVSFAGTREGAKNYTQAVPAAPPVIDPARQAEAVKAFMQKTGFANGRKGWVASFVIPICKGGRYESWNLQWVEAEKAAARAKRECE